MRFFKLTFMLLLAVLFVVAPTETFAMEEAAEECAESAEANAVMAAVAAAFLLVPSGIVAIRRRLRQN